MLLKSVLISLTYVALVSSSVHTCGPNQEWAEWRDACPPNCQFRHSPCIIETTQPPPGCVCKPGYIYLNSEREVCVEISKCPKICSDPLFVWNDCGTRCPKTCLQDDSRPCPEICEPGCFCPRKYVLNDLTLQCVKKRKCPIF